MPDAKEKRAQDAQDLVDNIKNGSVQFTCTSPDIVQIQPETGTVAFISRADQSTGSTCKVCLFEIGLLELMLGSYIEMKGEEEPTSTLIVVDYEDEQTDSLEHLESPSSLTN